MAWRRGVGADSRAHRAAARPASGDPLAPVHQCRGGQRALHELLPEEPAARLAAGGAWDGVPRDLQDQNPGAAARLAAQPACGRLDPRSRIAASLASTSSAYSLRPLTLVLSPMRPRTNNSPSSRKPASPVHSCPCANLVGPLACAPWYPSAT